MLQDMDHMDASCVFHLKVARFDQLEQSEIFVLTVTSLEIVMQTSAHCIVVAGSLHERLQGCVV